MKHTLIQIGLIILSIIAGIIAYPYLPDQIATHWGWNGEADGFTDKKIGIFMLPLIMLFSYLYFELSSKKSGKNKMLITFFNTVMLFFFSILHIVVLLIGSGYDISIDFVIGVTIGLLFIVLGNFMQKAKQNHVFGVRTTWTLSDKDVWRRTNRLGSKLFVISGLLLVIVSFLFPDYIMWVIIGSTLTSALSTIIASYSFYKKIHG